MSNPGVGIGWLSKPDFYGVNTQPVFDDNFCPISTKHQEGEHITKSNIGLQTSKNSVIPSIKTCGSIVHMQHCL